MGRPDTGTLGQWAEDAALRYLVDRGLRPLIRNFSTRGGEIDLVMLDGSCLVFVEVRCRRSTRFTKPALTVDRHKQRRIVRSAALYAARHREHASRRMRFDVLAVEGGSPPRVRWLRDAFRPDDSAF